MAPIRPIRQPGIGTPKVKGPSMRHNPPGGRHGTSLAQRNASRRNIRRAQIYKQARKLQ